MITLQCSLKAYSLYVANVLVRCTSLMIVFSRMYAKGRCKRHTDIGLLTAEGNSNCRRAHQEMRYPNVT